MRAILSGTARRGEHGQIIVLFALSLLAIVAMAGLLIDGGRAWEDRRQAQIAADTGALAAGLEYAKGATDTYAKAAAQSIAAMNGFNAATACDGTSLTSNGVTVTKPASDKVRVTVTRPLRTTFAGAVGQSCWMVSATAVAHYTGTSVTGPTVFAKGPTCGSNKALTWNGSDIAITGNVYSGGTVDINDNQGSITSGTLTWYDNPPSCDNLIDNGAVPPVPAVTTTIPQEYPITYTAADFPCDYTLTAAGGTQVDVGYPWYNAATKQLNPGVYCNHGGDIVIHNQGTWGNVTFVSDSFKISPKDTSFTPYLNGVLIFAEGSGSKTIDISAENTNFQGLIFAPLGDIHLVGASLGLHAGSIWGYTIELGGNLWLLQGAAVGSISPLEIVLVE